MFQIEKDEDNLTDKQKIIINYWEEGEYNQTKMSEELNMKQSQLSNNIKWMKKKGYDREKYKKEYPPVNMVNTKITAQPLI